MKTVEKFKVHRMKRICYHYTRPDCVAEYYGELLTTRRCARHDEAGDIVCNYLTQKKYQRRLARIVRISLGEEYVA